MGGFRKIDFGIDDDGNILYSVDGDATERKLEDKIGGSNTVRVVAAHVDVPDLLDGPQLIYAPQADEVIVTAVGLNAVQTDYTDTVVVAPIEGGDRGNTLFILADPPSYGFDRAQDARPVTAAQYAMLQASIEPAYVVGAWASATEFAGEPDSVAIVADGRIWVNTGATGTSGGVSPDFAGTAPAGSVADGADIVWTDQQYTLPTLGSFDVGLIVATVAP